MQLYINTEMCVNTLMFECTAFLVRHRQVSCDWLISDNTRL